VESCPCGSPLHLQRLLALLHMLHTSWSVTGDIFEHVGQQSGQGRLKSLCSASIGGT